MKATLPTRLAPGARVRVTQRIRHVDGDWPLVVEGELVAMTRRPTESGFAFGKDVRLWLDRLVLRKRDGERSSVR